MQTTCDNCGELAVTVERDNGQTMCELCWRDALSHGHSHGLHMDEDGNDIDVADCPDCAATSLFTILRVWLGENETFHTIRARSLTEALLIAEREDAGRRFAPDVYGIHPQHYAVARAENIAFNEADGLLMEQL